MDEELDTTEEGLAFCQIQCDGQVKRGCGPGNAKVLLGCE
jgi:hypothetical protein